MPLLSLPEAQDALVCTSAGKGWNLPAFKAGLIVRGREAAARFASLPPLTMGAMGQMARLAHTAALRHGQVWVDEVMAEITANKALLARLLAERVPGVRYVPEPGTYLAWVDCAGLGLDHPQQHFLRHGRVAFNVGTAFGFGFGTPPGDEGAQYRQFVRINLATSPALVTEAVERMAASLSA